MVNLTLSLDDDLLQKAREAALRENTSVNALVREYLTRYVDAKSRRLQALDTLDALAERTDSASRQRWSRDSLHEREAG
jgi:predicted transcriptional regulator